MSPLCEATTPALLELLPKVWRQQWGADYLAEVFRWRYLERPSSGGTLVALDGDRCIGVIDSYLRPYLLDGRRVLVRETADWFCLDEYRPFGIGLKLMRSLMRLPEPLLSIGGSAATLAVLPRLGWQQMSRVQRMVLPVTLRGLAANLLRRKHAERAKHALAIPGFLPAWPSRTVSPPAADATVVEWRPGVLPSIPAPRRGGLIEILEPAEFAWICAAPRRLLQPLLLQFRIGQQPVAISLSQLEPSAYGADGRIVHLQVADATRPVIDWIVSRTVQRLAEMGAGFIRCRATLGTAIAALRRAGFVVARSEPMYWWAKDAAPPPAVVEVGYLRADDALPFEAARTFNGRPLAAAG